MTPPNLRFPIESVEWELTPVRDPDFLAQIPEHYQLDDLMVSYSDGLHEKLVPLEYLMAHPLVYDERYQGEDKVPVTLTLCPISFNPLLYQGHCTFAGQKTSKGIILAKDKVKFYQFSGTPIDGPDKILPRWAVQVDTLRNLIRQDLDPQFMNTPKQQVISSIWNRPEDHRIVYGISYRSSTNPIENVKFTMVVPKLFHPNPLDSQKNGFAQYLSLYQNRIHQKEGLIQTTYFNSWAELYPKSRLVHLAPSDETLVTDDSEDIVG